MGVHAPGSTHGRPSAQPLINMSRHFSGLQFPLAWWKITKWVESFQWLHQSNHEAACRKHPASGISSFCFGSQSSDSWIFCVAVYQAHVSQQHNFLYPHSRIDFCNSQLSERYHVVCQIPRHTFCREKQLGFEWTILAWIKRVSCTWRSIQKGLSKKFKLVMLLYS